MALRLAAPVWLAVADGASVSPSVGLGASVEVAVALLLGLGTGGVTIVEFEGGITVNIVVGASVGDSSVGVLVGPGAGIDNVTPTAAQSCWATSMVAANSWGVHAAWTHGVSA